LPLETAAIELGVTVETARNHLKAIFNRTGTHRQGELVALLNKLSR
jgi:DNA-binding CsgD family transcriptional regulator